jgi:UrcA family protein
MAQRTQTERSAGDRWQRRGAKMSFTSKLVAGAAASVMSLACAGSYADTGAPIEFNHSMVVRYTDLDLSHSRDVARLYARISLAADKLCGPRSLTGAHAKSAIYTSCYADAVGQAVADVNHPALTTYYLQRSPHAVAVAQQ